jgi:hypothetical protein
MRKSTAQALARATKQLAKQNASIQRGVDRRKASGHYTAMELIALEAQTGRRYYNQTRMTGDVGYSNLDWRDNDNASK